MADYDAIVVGAGLAGSTAAHLCQYHRIEKTLWNTGRMFSNRDMVKALILMKTKNQISVRTGISGKSLQ